MNLTLQKKNIYIYIYILLQKCKSEVRYSISLDKPIPIVVLGTFEIENGSKDDFEADLGKYLQHQLSYVK